MGKESFLRPEFTQNLAARLLQGEHIKLIAKHGQGRRRTLHDIQQLLTNKICIHHIDLYRDHIELCTWLLPFTDANTPTLLIMHNFHCVHDILVFKQLKSMQSNPNLVFLSICETEHNQAPNNSNALHLPTL